MQATRAVGSVSAAIAMVAVGSGITVSADLSDYPVFSAQAIRYAIAAGLLVGGARLGGRVIPMPAGGDWMWLLLLAGSGQALYNVAVIEAVSEAEPAAVAVLIGAVPLLLTIGEALRNKTRPRPAMVAGALLVVAGAALVQGGGNTSAAGIGWSLLALGCEAAFTLLAVPILGRLGPLGVSTHTCWIAAAQLAVIGVIADDSAALPAMTEREAFAIVYLAVVLTAIAFVLWYFAVQQIGPATAGLFAGLIPVAAALTGLIGGLTTVSAAVVGGAAVVGVGIALGLTSSGRTPTTLHQGGDRDEAFEVVTA